MPELRFAITQQQKSFLRLFSLALVYSSLDPTSILATQENMVW